MEAHQSPAFLMLPLEIQEMCPGQGCALMMQLKYTNLMDLNIYHHYCMYKFIPKLMHVDMWSVLLSNWTIMGRIFIGCFKRLYCIAGQTFVIIGEKIDNIFADSKTANCRHREAVSSQFLFKNSFLSPSLQYMYTLKQQQQTSKTYCVEVLLWKFNDYFRDTCKVQTNH